jgi:proteasome lid subunit RPN8/RPN11
MVLEQRMIDTIAELGRTRAPNEACGLLLPVPLRGKQVIELPNRSKTPEDAFEMWGTDMVLALEPLFPNHELPETFIPTLTAWHTHPGGGLGPSRADLQNKPAYLQSLVVTLMPDGTAKATWF